MRARWLVLLWAGVAAAVWSGFYELMITRGAKEYLMQNALNRLGEAPPASLTGIMAKTSHDAAIQSTEWAGTVLAAGWLTIWLARRRP